MKLEGPVLRLTVFVGESDQWRHRPLFTEIVHRAHRAGLAGATVLRGIEGYGASSRIHTARLLSLAEELPVVVIIVDVEERIRAFLPQLDELLTGGLVTIEAVEVIRRAAHDRSGDHQAGPDRAGAHQTGPDRADRDDGGER